MFKTASFKVGGKIADTVKTIMRDPRYPFENESLYYARSTDELNRLWYELLAKNKKDKFIDFYNDSIYKIDDLKKNGFIDEHTRGIRKLEDIQLVL